MFITADITVAIIVLISCITNGVLCRGVLKLLCAEESHAVLIRITAPENLILQVLGKVEESAYFWPLP